MHSFLYLDIRTIYTKEELEDVIEALKNYIEYHFDGSFVLLKNFRYAKNVLDDQELQDIYTLTKELDDDVFKYLSSVIKEEELDIDMLVSEGIIKNEDSELGVDVLQVFYFFLTSLNNPSFQQLIYDSETEITHIFERGNASDFKKFINDYEIDLSNHQFVLVEVIAFEIVRLDAFNCYKEYSKTGQNPLLFMSDENQDRILVNLLRTTHKEFFESIVKETDKEFTNEVQSYIFFAKNAEMLAYFIDYFNVTEQQFIEAIEYINLYFIPQENLLYILNDDRFEKEKLIDGYSVLDVILEVGDMDVINAVLQKDYDLMRKVIIDDQNNYRFTYFRSIFNPNIKVFQTVIEFIGIDQLKDLEFLYYDALFNGLLKQAQYLHEQNYVKGEHIPHDHQYQLLKEIVKNKDFDTFQYVMDMYYTKNIIAYPVYDLFNHVLELNSIQFMEALLTKYGYHPNHKLKRQKALTYAIDHHYMEIAELLVKHGADCKTNWYQPLVYTYYERNNLKKDYPQLYSEIRNRIPPYELIRGYVRNGVLFVIAWALFSVLSYYFLLN
jgi:hemerythrin